MTEKLANQLVAWSGTGVTLAVLGWLWAQAPWTALWPVVSAVAAVVAAALVWTDVVPGRARDALPAMAAGLVLTGLAFVPYLLLPAATWPFEAAGWTLFAATAGVAAALGNAPGWRTGLRVGLGTAVVAGAGQALVFGLWLGQPVQAVVLEAQGALTRFQASHSTDFLVWSVNDVWSGAAPRLAAGAVLGAVAGFIGGLLRRGKAGSEKDSPQGRRGR